MSKQEFLEKLRIALSGRIPAGLVEENLSYYEEYINAQIRMGNTEVAVMQSLGDPRLIAKSIITANTEEGTFSNENSNGQEYSYNEEKYYSQVREIKLPKVFKVHGWVATAILVTVLVLFIGLVFSILYIARPFILIGIVAFFFFKLFKDWLK